MALSSSSHQVYGQKALAEALLCKRVQYWSDVGSLIRARCLLTSTLQTGQKEDAMGILAWIVLGLIAGAIAKFLMPGRDPGGWIVTMLLGIAGAVIGGWIGSRLWGSAGVSGFNLPSIGLAVLGAIVLLLIYRLIVGRGSGAGGIRRAA